METTVDKVDKNMNYINKIYKRHFIPLGYKLKLQFKKYN